MASVPSWVGFLAIIILAVVVAWYGGEPVEAVVYPFATVLLITNIILMLLFEANDRGRDRMPEQRPTPGTITTNDHHQPQQGPLLHGPLLHGPLHRRNSNYTEDSSSHGPESEYSQGYVNHSHNEGATSAQVDFIMPAPPQEPGFTVPPPMTRSESSDSITTSTSYAIVD